MRHLAVTTAAPGLTGSAASRATGSRVTALARADLSAPAVPTTTTSHLLIRSNAMHVIHEQLARAHSAQRLAEARHEQRINRVLAARRAQRRAEVAALRARRLMAIAVAR